MYLPVLLPVPFVFLKTESPPFLIPSCTRYLFPGRSLQTYFTPCHPHLQLSAFPRAQPNSRIFHLTPSIVRVCLDFYCDADFISPTAISLIMVNTEDMLEVVFIQISDHNWWYVLIISLMSSLARLSCPCFT